MVDSGEYLSSHAIGFVLIGPSGAGKSTLRDLLVEKGASGHSFVQYRPHTSRARRLGETDEYFFVDDAKLDEIERSSKILFRNDYHGNKFLTTWPKALKANEYYVYIYSPSAAKLIKQSFPRHRIIQVIPDDSVNLEEVMRRRDPNITPKELKARLSIIPQEIEFGAKLADDVFVNKTGIEESLIKFAELIARYLP